MSERTVRDVMSRELHTVGPNDKLSTASDVMRLGRIRHMPVVDDGELVGVVSQRDLFHNALLKSLGYGGNGARKLQDMCLVKEAMATTLWTTSPTTLLSEAAALM